MQNATRGRVAGLWATAIKNATICIRSPRQRAGTQDIGYVCFLTKGQDSDSRLPESRARRPPQRSIPCLDATRAALDLPHTLSCARARHNAHSATSLHEFWDEHLDRT